MLKVRFPFILMMLSGIALIVSALCRVAVLWLVVTAVIWLAMSLWTYFSVALPAHMASLGMDLLNSREYNHRLCKVGEPGADSVVSLYNKLIEELAQEQRRLMETNHFLDRLLSVSPQGVMIMDYDGMAVYANPSFCRMTGVRNPLGCTPGEMKGELAELIARLADGESRVLRMGDTEIYRCRRDYFLENGFRKSFITVDALTDEIRKAEKEAYSMIIRVISHEVNNSIGGIRSFLELVSSIPSVDGELREVAGACCHRCDSLRQFIEGYSKIVKMGDPDMQRVDLNALLIKIRPFLATLFHDGVGLEYDLSPGELYVAADASYLEQIVVNVVKNAVESIGAARSGGGIVRLSTLSGDCATLLIDDNGAGLSAADSENIFRPFFTTKKKNQGLGLTFVAEALRQQNCRFGLKTLSPGLTRFHVNFSKA